jgi:hypothetical protein
MTWKFQPPSGKDSWKRSATRYKIRKVEIRGVKVYRDEGGVTIAEIFEAARCARLSKSHSCSSSLH